MNHLKPSSSEDIRIPQMYRTEKKTTTKKQTNENEKTACAFYPVQVPVRTAGIHKILLIEIIN